MRVLRGVVLWGCGLICSASMLGQSPSADPTETLHTTTQLVVLDATVVDKHGHIITTPLTRDDFEVQEDRQPQVIRYFESAAEHDAEIERGTPNKAPLLIVVLDEVNFPYHHAESNADNVEEQVNDYEYLRTEMVRYLEAQPATLNEPMEVFALTHHGYLIVTPQTRPRPSYRKAEAA